MKATLACQAITGEPAQKGTRNMGSKPRQITCNNGGMQDIWRFFCCRAMIALQLQSLSFAAVIIPLGSALEQLIVNTLASESAPQKQHVRSFV